MDTSSITVPPGVAETASMLTRLFERSAKVFLERLQEGRDGGPRPVRERLRELRGGIGLYIHMPFCHRPLCRFCCFVRYPYDPRRASLYRRAVTREIREQASLAEEARPRSIYVGGGTPSLDPEMLAEILDAALEAWGLSRGEVTVSVEANPRDVDDAFVSQLRGIVDRLSLGAQALSNERLRRLGRLNSTVEDLEKALSAARGRFHTLNVDIVWGLPGEGPEETRREARRALELGVEQVTFYPIMPTPATRRMVVEAGGGPWSPVDRLNYEAILGEALARGYRPSTPWCMSRAAAAPVDEYIVETPWFIAAGPSGITRLPGLVAVNAFLVENYATRVEERGLGTGYTVKPTLLEDALYQAESILFGLTWRTGLLAETYGRLGAMLDAYIEASLRLLGEKPGPHGEWRIERASSLYALHRSQHILYTALAWFRHTVLEAEAAEAAPGARLIATPLPA